MFDYFNLVEWIVALASLIAWARFATFISRDVHDHLANQPELPWRCMGAGVLILMFVIYLLMPWFWLGLMLNVLVAGGGVGAFWHMRVKELGSKGHLFRRTIETAARASRRVEEHRVAKQVQLSYLRHDDSQMPLPKPDDPVAAGLSTADQMVIQALTRRAEQVELAPASGGYMVKYFVDGLGYPQPVVGRNVSEPSIQAIKILAGLSLEERRRPQTGSFKTRDADGVITTWAVRTSGTTAGERLSLSANEKGQWDLRIDQLGMTADQLAEVRKAGADTLGAVVVGSPRMSGRTTTLYALVRLHDAFTNSVQTLESNPLAEIEGVTVNRFDTRDAELSYAKALNSVFLKDPNVVLSAQCPDVATADAIARFGADGRRVYVGMPAFDTFAALEMWLGMVSDKSQAMKALRLVISQRLVRILCPTCKIPYQPDDQTLRKLNLPIGRNLQSFKANTEPMVDKKGNRIVCPDCGGNGYRGRTGIFEVLAINDDIRKAIASNATINQVKAMARKNNMILLVEHGIRKFATGMTSINEVTRVLTPEKGANPSASSGVLPAEMNTELPVF